MKKFLFAALAVFLLLQPEESKAQVSAGIYQQNLNTYLAIGTDPDEKMFGELRLGAGDELDLEGTFGYNFIQKQEVNFYSGAHLGVANLTTDFSEAYLGVPLGLLVKPFSAAPNLGFLLEASPLVGFDSGDGYLRAGIGLKYTFR
ncbi:outer membrane insertion C- signal [Echinicola rosea]|nr:outer membrane insertion C- signal [Echinicola rosea]